MGLNCFLNNIPIWCWLFIVLDPEGNFGTGVQIITVNREEDVHIIEGETIELMLPDGSDVGNMVTIETAETQELNQ